MPDRREPCKYHNLGHLKFSSRLFISISVEQRRQGVWPGLKTEQFKLLFSSFCFNLCFYPGQHFISPPHYTPLFASVQVRSIVRILFFILSTFPVSLPTTKYFLAANQYSRGRQVETNRKAGKTVSAASQLFLLHFL